MNFKIVSFQISKPDSLRVINQGWLFNGISRWSENRKNPKFPEKFPSRSQLWLKSVFRLIWIYFFGTNWLNENFEGIKRSEFR